MCGYVTLSLFMCVRNPLNYYVLNVCTVNTACVFVTKDRVMLTGRHMVRDVSCKSCDAKLGWIYEFATEETQRYKEGRVILERALVTEIESFDDGLSSAAPPPIIDNNN